MGLFKFGNYRSAKNNGEVRATQVTKNGYAFKVVNNYTSSTDGTFYNKAALPFDDDAEAKTGQVWVAMNVEDKPIKVGEYIRAFNLNDMIGEKIEMSEDLCTASFNEVSEGDILVPIPAGIDEMKWKVTKDTGYGVCFEVVEKTTFGMFIIEDAAGGYTCRIKSN